MAVWDLVCLWLMLAAMGWGFPQVESGALADGLFEEAGGRLAERQLAEAEALFGKCYALEPARLRCAQGRAQAMELQARGVDAMGILRQAAGKVKEQFEVHSAIAMLAGRLGLYDVAVGEFDGLLKRPGLEKKEVGEIHGQMGEAYRRKGDLTSAIRHFQRSKELLPNHTGLLLRLAQALDNAGQKKAAADEYRAVLDIDSSNVGALNNLAYLLVEEGIDLDAALAHAFHAQQLAPDMPEVKDTLGWVYFKRGSLDAALAGLQEVVREQGGSASYRYHLAMVLEKKGLSARAMEEARVALENKPGAADEKKIRALMERLERGTKP